MNISVQFLFSSVKVGFPYETLSDLDLLHRPGSLQEDRDFMPVLPMYLYFSEYSDFSEY